MLLVAIIAMAFFGVAQRRKLVPWLWAIIGVISYFAGQFIAGMFIGMFSPEMLYGSDSDLILPALVGGLATVGVAYVILEIVARNKNKKNEDDTLLDNRQVDEL